MPLFQRTRQDRRRLVLRWLPRAVGDAVGKAELGRPQPELAHVCHHGGRRAGTGLREQRLGQPLSGAPVEAVQELFDEGRLVRELAPVQARGRRRAPRQAPRRRRPGARPPPRPGGLRAPGWAAGWTSTVIVAMWSSPASGSCNVDMMPSATRAERARCSSSSMLGTSSTLPSVYPAQGEARSPGWTLTAIRRPLDTTAAWIPSTQARWCSGSQPMKPVLWSWWSTRTTVPASGSLGSGPAAEAVELRDAGEHGAARPAPAAPGRVRGGRRSTPARRRRSGRAGAARRRRSSVSSEAPPTLGRAKRAMRAASARRQPQAASRRGSGCVASEERRPPVAPPACAILSRSALSSRCVAIGRR